MPRKNINRKVYLIEHDYKIKEYPYSDIEADKKSFGSWESNRYFITFHFAGVFYYYDRDYAVKQAHKEKDERLKKIKGVIKGCHSTIDEYVNELERVLKIEIK